MTRVFLVPGDKLDKTKELVAHDLFKRNGYELRNSEGLGLEGKNFYLYVDGDDEFWGNVKEMLDALELKELEGEELEKVSSKFKEQIGNSAMGVGALFK